jgi:hypothetical protein
VVERTSEQATPRERQSSRAAFIVFVVVLVFAVPYVLFGVGSYHWFFRDDFFFITNRNATSVNDLFRPYDGHWTTVPVLIFRTLWALFGLRTYVPYQASVLALHLGACALLRVIMRRAGVGPWIATAAASTFILFGPGQENIIWAFQVGFTGSLTWGLAQLVLADHDGPVDKRDAFGIAAGALALLSSGVGIAMAIVAGMAILGRRGWKAALLHTAPLGAAYIIWWSIEHPQLTAPLGRPSVGVTFRWIKSSEIGVFLALGRYQIVAALLAVVFVIGLVLAWSPLGWSGLRRLASTPIAMVVGAVVFAGFTAASRWYLGSEFARSSRYLYIGTALTLPALAVAVNAILRRRREVGIAALALLVVAIPWNATHFDQNSVFGKNYMKSRKQILTNVVRLPEAREVPRDVRPIADVYVGPDLTIGFLLDAEKAGKLKAATGPISPQLEGELIVKIGVAQDTGGAPTDCRQLSRTLEIKPAKGTVYSIMTPVTISRRNSAGQWSPPVSFNPIDGSTLTIELRGLDLRLAPGRTGSFTLCSIA